MRRNFKSMLHILTLILSSALLPYYLLAQSDTLSSKQVEAFNLYVEFTNDNIHALWNYHNEFTKFNKELLQYQEMTPEKRVSSSLSFKDKPFLHLDEDYKILPWKSYYKTRQNSTYLPYGVANQLNAFLTSIWGCTENIEAVSEQLDAHVNSGLEKNDQWINEAYRILGLAEEQYTQFHELTHNLEFGLQSGYEMFAPPNKNDPFVKKAILLLNLISPCSDIMEAMRADDLEGVEAGLVDLNVMRELYIEEIGEQLNEVRFLGDDNPEPHIRYDFILRQIDNFRKYARTYLDKFDVEYKLPHGNSWFYYNNRLINQFNRFGRGLALQYNHYVDSTDVAMLKILEAPNWMKATEPGDFEIPESFVEKLPQDTTLPVPGAISLEGYAYNNLVFLLDVSSSMNKPGKLDLLQSSFKFLVNLMRPQDRVSIVTYSGDAKVVLPSTSAVEKIKIIQAIDSLESKGTSQVIEGFQAAKSEAKRHFINDGNNKIILASDGAFSEDKQLSKLVRELGKENISLTVFYYSQTEKPEEANRLRKLSRLGKGNYTHISESNSDKIMVREAQKVKESSNE